MGKAIVIRNKIISDTPNTTGNSSMDADILFNGIMLEMFRPTHAMFGSFAPVLVDSSHSPKFHSLQIILVFETVLPNRFIIHILTATDCPLVSSHW